MESGGADGSREDRHKLACLLTEAVEIGAAHDLRAGDELQPEARFVALLGDHSNLRRELGM